MRCACVSDIVIIHQLLTGAFPARSLGFLARDDTDAPHKRPIVQAGNGCIQRSFVACGVEQGVLSIVELLRGQRALRRNDRHAGGHCFQKRQPDLFVERRKDESIA